MQAQQLLSSLAILLYIIAIGYIITKLLLHKAPMQRPGLLGTGALAAGFHGAALCAQLFTPEGLDLGLFTITSLVG